MFVARPPSGSPQRRDLRLVRAERRVFTGPAEYLADPDNLARVGEYLTDLAGPHAIEVPAALFRDPRSSALGHSYGEMAGALIDAVAPADEPVDLLVLAFSIHDLRPGRQTAAYLSHLTPGAPMAFAICDQGSAAAFSGLRIASEYAASAGIQRALLIVVEQASLPYDSPAPLPSRHQAVAMLYSAIPDGVMPDSAVPDGAVRDSAVPDSALPDGAIRPARVADVRQHPAVPPSDVAGPAASDLAELASGHDSVGLVLSDSLAAAWPIPAAGPVRVMPPGQPSTGVWWGLIDELSAGPDRPELLIVADYDANLHYLSLTALQTIT